MTGTDVTEIDYTQTPYISELKAIHLHCLQCGDGTEAEVRNCELTHCNLWPLRLGHNPTRKKRKLTEQERNDAAARFAEYRQNKNQEATN